MQRVALAAALVVATVMIAVPSSATAPPTYAVVAPSVDPIPSSSPAALLPPGTVAIRDRAVLYGDIAPFGDVTMTYDLCIVLSGLTDSEAEHIGSCRDHGPRWNGTRGRVGPVKPGHSPFGYHLDVVVTGGTGDFSGIVGNLVLDGTTGTPGNAATGTASGTVALRRRW